MTVPAPDAPIVPPITEPDWAEPEEIDSWLDASELPNPEYAREDDPTIDGTPVIDPLED